MGIASQTQGRQKKRGKTQICVLPLFLEILDTSQITGDLDDHGRCAVIIQFQSDICSISPVGPCLHGLAWHPLRRIVFGIDLRYKTKIIFANQKDAIFLSFVVFSKAARSGLRKPLLRHTFHSLYRHCKTVASSKFSFATKVNVMTLIFYSLLLPSSYMSSKDSAGTMKRLFFLPSTR